MKEDIIIITILIVSIIITTCLLMMIIIDCTNTIVCSKLRKKIFNSLGNILLTYYKDDSVLACVEEIKLIFKHIINKNNDLKRNYTSVDILLEKYLIELNDRNHNLIALNIEDTDMLKTYILKVIKEFKKNNPMEQIKGANNILLNQLIESVDNDDSDKFYEIVNQLAIEIKTMQDNILEKDKNSKKQDVISKVGIILSIVFGVMTFIQFFV